MPTVVVTRPQPDAQAWVEQLQDAGLSATALPLMVIGPCRSPAATARLQQALADIARYRALMFVSANAVRHFFAAWQTVQPARFAEHTRFWSPGPGTSKALLLHGVEAHRLVQPAAHATQFDSESLWAQAQQQIQADDRVLIIRGGDGQQALGHGRQWLSEQLQQHQVQVDFVPVYERQPPAATPELLQRIEALRTRQALWLFSSSECVQHLQRCHPTQSWQAHTALATHPRIAAQARQAGFGRVIETLPTVQSIAASIKSIA